MKFPNKDMEAENIFIYKFVGEDAKVKWTIRLQELEKSFLVTETVQFMVVDQESSHNVLLRYPFQ